MQPAAGLRVSADRGARAWGPSPSPRHRALPQHRSPDTHLDARPRGLGPASHTPAATLVAERQGARARAAPWLGLRQVPLNARPPPPPLRSSLQPRGGPRAGGARAHGEHARGTDAAPPTPRPFLLLAILRPEADVGKIRGERVPSSVTAARARARPPRPSARPAGTREGRRGWRAGLREAPPSTPQPLAPQSEGPPGGGAKPSHTLPLAASDWSQRRAERRAVHRLAV